MKNLRKPSIVIRLAVCVLAAFSTGSAFSSNPWIESHVSTTYGYVLGRGEAAGRSLAAARPARSDDSKAKAPRRAAAPNPRLASGS